MTITTCELCNKKLDTSEFLICKLCDQKYDSWRVWRGKPTMFGSGEDIAMLTKAKVESIETYTNKTADKFAYHAPRLPGRTSFLH